LVRASRYKEKRIKDSLASSGAVWFEVEEALEAIIDRYEKVNHVISLFQDEKARRVGLETMGSLQGVGLELGSGPGNFTREILRSLDGFLLGLDYSGRMLGSARSRVRSQRLGLVRAVFGYLPIRPGSLCFVAAAFALRDSVDKERVMTDVSLALGAKGKFLIVDVGKPDNPFVEGLFRMYMRFIMPILAGLVGREGYRNPWRMLFETYRILPQNRDILRMLTHNLGSARMRKMTQGALAVFLAEKGIRTPRNASKDS
jgi:demethylmenaquinone methyltransferase/2-methoxy-6-polyprenyl-1,4-benzoquinol methylase